MPGRSVALPTIALGLVLASGVAGADRAKDHVREARQAAREMFAQPASRFDSQPPTISSSELEVHWNSRGVIRVVRPDGVPFDYSVEREPRQVRYLESDDQLADDPVAREMAAALAAGDRFPRAQKPLAPRPGYRVFYDDMPTVQIINRRTGRSSLWQIDGKGRLRTTSRSYRKPSGARFEAVSYPTTAFPRSQHSISRSVPRRGAGSRAFRLEPLAEVEDLSFNVGQPRRKDGTLGPAVLHSVRIEGPDRNSFRQIERSGRIYMSDGGKMTQRRIAPGAARKKMRALYRSAATGRRR
jgi:hypothetical protein